MHLQILCYKGDITKEASLPHGLHTFHNLQKNLKHLQNTGALIIWKAAWQFTFVGCDGFL